MAPPPKKPAPKPAAKPARKAQPAAPAAAVNDILIGVVFPDYQIAVPTPAIDLPKWLNDRGVPDIKKNAKVGHLGHAGVLLINGASGLSKYFEFGRYGPREVGVPPGAVVPPSGLTRTHSVPNVKMSSPGNPDWKSLKATLKAVSMKGGHGTRITGAYVSGPGYFALADKHATDRMKKNSDKTRLEYSLGPADGNTFFNTCATFMMDVIGAAGVPMPVCIDPRPISYAGELQDDFPDLDYDPKADTLVIEGIATA